MPCFRPLTAYQCADGQVVFVERRRFDVVRQLQLPCGQCIGCRLERSRQWAARCMAEAKSHKRNCFVTLTYSDEYLPARSSLDYSHFQKFMRRLRKSGARNAVRFYMCGEYGPQGDRPHFHACLFNWDFADKTYWRTSESGSKCFRSRELERLWPYGHCEIGDVTFESAGYVARYCCKKVTGHNAAAHYRRVDLDTGEVYQVTPEFAHMSLKPGIGARFIEQYHRDVYPHDYLVVRGHETKPPRYFDKWFSLHFPEEFEQVQFQRESDARARYEDNTPARLAVKEEVQTARASFLKRSSV